MKSFKQHIFEKLKVSANSKIDTRDDDTVGKLYGNDEDKVRFQKYLHDCLKRDKYNIQTYNINFIHDRVMFYFVQDGISIILCPFSTDDTYIVLYNRIIDNLKKKQFITEKLKIRTDIHVKTDHRDYELLGDLSHLATGNNFLNYVYDCFKRDKVKDGFYFGPTKDVISIIYKKFKRQIKYSPDETYIELYNKIIDVLREKNFITEKLRITNNSNREQEYKDKTNRVTYYNAHSYHSTILEVDNVDLFMDYWYYFLESEDDALKENLDLHWDDIYLDYDAHDVYVLDNNTGDEIVISYDENPRSFYNIYNRIIRYFEKKNG